MPFGLSVIFVRLFSKSPNWARASRSARAARIGRSGAAKIIEVGTQFEPLPPALQIPATGQYRIGFALSISVPPSLKIRPGELVDLILLPTIDAAR
jgi:hypothetical protein